MKSLFVSLILVALAWDVSVRAANTQAPFYTVQPMEVFNDSYEGFDPRLNNRGDIVSLAITNEDYSEAHLVIVGRGLTNIVPVPVLQYSRSPLLGFNNKGDALVSAGFTDYLVRGGEVTYLSNLVDATYFTVGGINARGGIVGGAQPADGGPSFAFKHYRGKQKTFPKLVPNSHAIAWAVNNHGVAVGGAQVVSDALGSIDFYHAVIFRAGRPQDLGTLDGGSLSMATDINDRGEIIGFSTKTNDSIQQAFYYRAGQMRQLPALPEDSRSEAIDINNKGQIVGHSVSGDDEFSVSRPMIYIKGAVYDLNACIPEDSGLTLVKVYSINDRGLILASAEEVGVVLLTPGKRPKNSEPE